MLPDTCIYTEAKVCYVQIMIVNRMIKHLDQGLVIPGTVRATPVSKQFIICLHQL